MIWVVSATYPASHERPWPTPLQDNGHTLVRAGWRALGFDDPNDLQKIRIALNYVWGAIIMFLAALSSVFLGIAGKTWRRRPINMFGRRILCTLTALRVGLAGIGCTR